ncbi:MAG: hypothetical protein Q9176_003286 [Flavoplaca citrina]
MACEVTGNFEYYEAPDGPLRACTGCKVSAMDIPSNAKDQLPVQNAIEEDTAAAIETAKAIKPDAGLRSLDHYKIKLPSWRYAARQRLIPAIRWETPYVARLQSAMRSPILDSYFSITANLGTHTFFMIFLPILFWCGYTDLGRG